VATPVSGASFVAWVNSDNNAVISQNATFQLKPYAATMNIQAVFTKADQPAYFMTNSTMYTDMIYKHIPVVRFKNGKTDLYPDLADKGFSSATELRGVLTQMRSEPESFRQSQELLYKQVFGASCGPDSYRDFYRDWGR